jgi:hypothetical protein
LRTVSIRPGVAVARNRRTSEHDNHSARRGGDCRAPRTLHRLSNHPVRDDRHCRALRFRLAVRASVRLSQIVASRYTSRARNNDS